MSGRKLLVCSWAAAVLAFALHAVAGAGPGEPCAQPADCRVPHALCINGKCQCATGYEVNGTTCIIQLNSRCNATHLCNRTGAQCVNNACVCRSNYVLSADYRNCVPVATSINQSCEVQAQCREFLNSSCTAGTCKCIPGHIYSSEGKSCQHPGSATEAPTQAPGLSPHVTVLPSQVPEIRSSVAPSPAPQPAYYFPPPADVLHAAVGFAPDDADQQTSASSSQQVAAHGPLGLDGSCSIDGNCKASVPHSWCRGGKCICADGYERNGTTCTIKIMSPCNATHLCNRTGADCHGGICLCKSTYYLQGGNCLKGAEYVYGNCSNEAECSTVLGTTCRSKNCVCKDGYFQHSNKRSCDQLTCQGTKNCANMGNAVCVGTNCVCVASDFQFEGKCYKKIGKVGDKCDTKKNELCWLEANGNFQNVECNSGKCKCKKNYKPDKSNTRCDSGAPVTAVSLFLLVLAVAKSFLV